jgi:transcription initiation factor TFIID subunit 2
VPDADYQVRWAVLKLADLAFRAAEEPPPKVTISIPPPTPVLEVPASLPLKIQPKAQRAAKSAHANSPVLATTIAPKLKLLPSGSHKDAVPKTPVISEQRRGSFVIPPPKRSQPQKKKVVPKSQTAGMSFYDLGACRTALKKLQSHKRAKLFLQPVDPVRDRAPEFVLPLCEITFH